MYQYLLSIKYLVGFFICTLCSIQANAMGLGEIKVSSHLNQPLNASVKLLNPQDLNVIELSARLADKKEFQRIGLQRFYFLTNLKFKIKKDKYGDIFVNITSTRSVKEPFLNFLLEVNWPKGRLLREYTLLMDLPEFAPKPMLESKLAQQKTKTSINNSVTSDNTDIPASVANSQKHNIYHVNSNDSMWGIALKTRPNKSVSPQQTMLAIQKLNPGAFLYGNINLIRQQQKLKIPTLSQVKELSRTNAIRLVARQNRSFKDKSYKKKVAQAVIQTTEPGPEPSIHIVNSKSRGELRLLVPHSKDKPDQKDDTASVKIHRKKAFTSKESLQNKESIENELAISLEKEVSIRKTNLELKQRMMIMQKKLEKLEALLAIKNDAIASLLRISEKNKIDLKYNKPEIVNN